MSDIAIRAEGLGKMYRISEGARRGSTYRYRTLQEDLLALPRRLASRVTLSRGDKESFWALRDISFQVRQGEVLGIIGRNGAGKSTLLKILSRITDPTEGRAELHGRVGTLLEVGTGFHPELTGRENIFLSGAILGMRRREIVRRFDEIVEFAEVEKFIDIPVKHFSSGMYMRLAFSVAAHLDPEILIVDEVLAVGDAAFQKKCLGKMDEVAHQGRTVLFVSHSMEAITRLCQRAMLLSSGQVLLSGAAGDVASEYARLSMTAWCTREWPNLDTAPGNDIVRLRSIRASSPDASGSAFDIRRPITIEMEYDVLTPGHVLAPNINVSNDAGQCIFASIDLDPQWRFEPRPSGRFRSRVVIPGNFLADGMVLVRAHITTLGVLQHHVTVSDAVVFTVIDSHDGDSARGDYRGPLPGAVRPLLYWEDELIRTCM